MFFGIMGAVIGYLILTSLLVWFIIFSKGRILLKVFAVGFSIYYAMGLYYLLPNMQGWPTGQEIPDGSILISIRVQEPYGADPGAFYLWVNTKPDRKGHAINFIRPNGFLSYAGGKQPRAYKIPYDRETHTRLAEAKKENKQQGGWIEIVKGQKKKGKPGKGDKDGDSEKIGFKVINPVEVLKKNNGTPDNKPNHNLDRHRHLDRQ